MKNTILYHFVFLISSLLYGQNPICGISTFEKNFISCLQNGQTANSINNNIVKLICEEIGIAPNFIYVNCPNIANAGAIINEYKNNARYIVFDNLYYTSLYKNNNYSSLFIIAHEIGHHLNGHTIPKDFENVNEVQKQELEADYFAGYILFKLGAKENDIITTINKFTEPTSNYSTHPKNTLRIKYALKGYLNEANKYQAELYQIRDKLQKDINSKIEYERYKELIEVINQHAITGEEKFLDIAEYILKNIESKNILIEELMAYVNYKKGRYELAMNFYQNQYLKTKVPDDLAEFLNILSKTNIQSNQINSILNSLESTVNTPKELLNLGIYFKQIDKDSKSKIYFKQAYELIKYKENSLLKADILFSYGRTLYDEELLKDEPNLSFAKLMLMNSKDIIENYPKDINYYLYFNSILFHLGNIQSIEGDYSGAVVLYKELLANKPERQDYIYKVNGSIANCFKELGKHHESIQYYTNAINFSDNDEFKRQYYYLRAMQYIKLDIPDLAVADLKLSCELGYQNACKLFE